MAKITNDDRANAHKILITVTRNAYGGNLQSGEVVIAAALCAERERCAVKVEALIESYENSGMAQAALREAASELRGEGCESTGSIASKTESEI